MPRTFAMDYIVPNRTAAELFAKLQAVKQIEKMKQNVVRTHEFWIEYYRGMTFSENPFRVVVAFRDAEGGARVVIDSACVNALQLMDRGRNEKNCIAVREAIALLPQ